MRVDTKRGVISEEPRPREMTLYMLTTLPSGPAMKGSGVVMYQRISSGEGVTGYGTGARDGRVRGARACTSMHDFTFPLFTCKYVPYSLQLDLYYFFFLL